ncbi:FmdB family zinc ribbon protein [Rhodovulum marinum]|uniref:Putative FmdB family regulatory protein n=1 Tax=Rhodovulum marinum TaxID=320662 RepID=A0A4R2Q3B2_9RHOB|nr:zinc ribbon domain-containing protein [Rhodovulum marinum]TCP42188.1 putative FmdB family regulatory protein [Rhodovulum marinum]
MPYYDYACDDCGPFTGFAAMADFDKPAACPCCGGEAPRALFTAPKLAIVGSSVRRAHETNERAQHEPKRSGHGAGCSCCSGGSKKKSGTLHRPDGSKSFPGKRPWMISH